MKDCKIKKKKTSKHQSKYKRDANTKLLQQQNDRDASEDYKIFCHAKLWKNSLCISTLLIGH